MNKQIQLERGLIRNNDLKNINKNQYSSQREIEQETRNLMTAFIEKNPDEPFYILDEERLRSHAEFLQSHFLPDLDSANIAYAVKANPENRVLEVLGDAGITHFDCASIGEVNLVKSIHPDSKILFNHPYKRLSHIQSSVNQNIRHFTAQTTYEIEKIHSQVEDSEIPHTEIAIRVKTPNERSYIDFSDKFGAMPEDVLEMLEHAKNLGFKTGLSMHTGSQNESGNSYESGLKMLASLAKISGGVESLNLGGGLPVNYFEHDNFDIKGYLDQINRCFTKEVLGVFLDEPRIYLELGRALVAETVTLLIPILGEEVINGQRNIYFADGIFGSFSDSYIHNWQYNFQVIRAGEILTGEESAVNLCGQTCDPKDVINDVILPKDLRPWEDYILVSNAGAYMDCQRSNFNGFDPMKYISRKPKTTFDYKCLSASGPTSKIKKSEIIEDENDTRNNESEVEPESKKIQIENLDPEKLSESEIRELSDFYREIFCNGPYFQYAFHEDDPLTPIAPSEIILGRDPEKGDYFTLEELDNQDLPSGVHRWMDSKISFEITKERIKSHTYITCLKKEEKVVGLVYGRATSLRDIFETEEMKNPLLLSGLEIPEILLDELTFFENMKSNFGIEEEGEVFHISCQALHPDFQNFNNFYSIMSEFFKQIPKEKLDLFFFAEVPDNDSASVLDRAITEREVFGVLGNGHSIVICNQTHYLSDYFLGSKAELLGKIKAYLKAQKQRTKPLKKNI